MSNYQHPDDINLKNLHKSMVYTEDGKPAVRVLSNIQGDISIEGDVNIPGEVTVKNPDGESLSVSGEVTVDGDVNVTGSVGVTYDDSEALSAFSRLRTAGTRLLGEFRNHYGTTGLIDILTHFEGSGSQTVNLPNNNTTIHVTTANGDRAVRQSRQYHPYIPGTTTMGIISFVFGATKPNLQQSVGLYDDSNGIFLRMNGSTPELVIRKSGVDDQVVTQQNWSVDKFDGEGKSGINLDFTKAQILIIDYQWLGVGRVRVGFNVGGRIFYAHYFKNANVAEEPFMNQPSLPVRWEIKNTGTTTSNSTMMCICFAVYTEGSEAETGFENTISNGTTPVTLSNNDPRVILAVKLKDTVNGIPVRALARLKDWQVLTSENIRYRVLIIPDQTFFTTTPTWTDVPSVGWCEYSTNLALNTFTPDPSIVLFDGYASPGKNKAETEQFTIENRSAAIHQNFDATDSLVFVVQAQRLTNQTTTVYSSLNWIEVK